MDFVSYEAAPLHTRGTNHRQGSFRYKDLGRGTPGELGNFYLRLVWTEGDFFSPRHMHNFDQVRVQIKGRFSFDKDGTMHPGGIGYFPEGTAYGPQTSAEDTIQLAMQIGGPSRSGYISEDERQQAVEALSKRGRFEKGKFHANDDRTGAGQDGFEAVWEYANGRRIKYPKKRLEKPLLVNPDAFDWLHVAGSPGVRAKRLWDFGSSSLSCSIYELGAGSTVSLTGPLTVFVLSGKGAAGEHRYSQYDALHLAGGEAARIEAREASELLVMPHPVFAQPAARTSAARTGAFMNVAHDESTPWGPARTVRGGRIVFKELLRGAEKTPTNFSLVLADTDVTFKSPRHRHNFDQIRITLEGSTNFGPRHNIEVGDVAYFPEGTHYGPQNQELVGKTSLAMVIQFGGASGNGYMSQRELFEGQERLRVFGDFEGGVFRRKAAAPDGRMNQDAYEAIWEYQNGRPVEYAKPRMTEPVHFRAANLPWVEIDGPGVYWKDLGSFTERNIRIACLKLDKDAVYTPEREAQEQIIFITEGAGRFATGETWSPRSAIHLAATEAPAMTATAATEALILFLPRF